MLRNCSSKLGGEKALGRGAEKKNIDSSFYQRKILLVCTCVFNQGERPGIRIKSLVSSSLTNSNTIICTVYDFGLPGIFHKPDYNVPVTYYYGILSSRAIIMICNASILPNLHIVCISVRLVSICVRKMEVSLWTKHPPSGSVRSTSSPVCGSWSSTSSNNFVLTGHIHNSNSLKNARCNIKIIGNEWFVVGVASHYRF